MAEGGESKTPLSGWYLSVHVKVYPMGLGRQEWTVFVLINRIIKV